MMMPKRQLYKYDKDKIKRYIKDKSKKSIKKEKKKYDETFNWIIDKSYGLEQTDMGLIKRNYIKQLNDFYQSRKIPYEYRLYICHSGRYRNRIIIPIFDENNDIIYFQARRAPKSTLEPKIR
jgi:hypothetical protein